MVAKVMLFSYKHGEINNFLDKFYNSFSSVDFNSQNSNSLFWKKEFDNPVEISEIIAAFADNNHSFGINMWISLDKDVFIKISPSNVNTVIKYLFERYPY